MSSQFVYLLYFLFYFLVFDCSSASCQLFPAICSQFHLCLDISPPRVYINCVPVHLCQIILFPRDNVPAIFFLCLFHQFVYEADCIWTEFLACQFWYCCIYCLSSCVSTFAWLNDIDFFPASELQVPNLSEFDYPTEKIWINASSQCLILCLR